MLTAQCVFDIMTLLSIHIWYGLVVCCLHFLFCSASAKASTVCFLGHLAMSLAKYFTCCSPNGISVSLSSIGYDNSEQVWCWRCDLISEYLSQNRRTSPIDAISSLFSLCGFAHCTGQNRKETLQLLSENLSRKNGGSGPLMADKTAVGVIQ